MCEKKKPECLRRSRLIPLYITGQAHARFDHKSVLFFFTLPFFVLCGHSGDSFVKGRENHSSFHHVETEDRAMAKAEEEYSCAAICVLWNREELLSLLTS